MLALAPCRAAPVRIRPRIGPAQGAQSRPVATPSRSDGANEPPPCSRASMVSDNRPPRATSGRVRRSAKAGNSRVRPNRARSAIAAQRPAALACTAQPPATEASVATAANARHSPSSIGRPLCTNLRSALAKTKGRTGRMQGLTMVRHAAEIGQQEQDHGRVRARIRLWPCGRSWRRRSCNSAVPWAWGRRRTHGPDGRRSDCSAPRCGPCRSSGPSGVMTECGSGAQKLGQPVPLSNLVLDENASWAQPAQANRPSRCSFRSGLVNGDFRPRLPQNGVLRRRQSSAPLHVRQRQGIKGGRGGPRSAHERVHRRSRNGGEQHASSGDHEVPPIIDRSRRSRYYI